MEFASSSRTSIINGDAAAGSRRRHAVEAQVSSNPGVHEARGREPAKESQATRAPTDRVSEFGTRGKGGFQHDVGHNSRLVSSLDELPYPSPQDCTNVSILIEFRVRFQQVRVELRLCVRGLDDRDADALRAQLVVE